MDFTVKKAIPEDLDAIAALYAAACDYLQDKPCNPNWRKDIFPARENAEEALTEGTLYAAWDGGTLVGSIVLNTNPSAERTGEEDTLSGGTDADIFYVHLVAVHPEHLRRGVSGAMLDFTAKEAASRGAKAVRLYVWTENTPAIRAYEKSGYVRLAKADIGLGEYGLPWFYMYEKRL